MTFNIILATDGSLMLSVILCYVHVSSQLRRHRARLCCAMIQLALHTKLS